MKQSYILQMGFKIGTVCILGLICFCILSTYCVRTVPCFLAFCKSFFNSDLFFLPCVNVGLYAFRIVPSNAASYAKTPNQLVITFQPQVTSGQVQFPSLCVVPASVHLTISFPNN